MLLKEHENSSDAASGLQLVHLSDPHLTSLKGIAWSELTNKRILGYLSWLARRKRSHQARVLMAMLNDLQALCPDHIAITGDLTHIGTGGEFREVRRWLAELGPPDKVTIIPGNHDQYVRTNWSETLQHWLPYLQDETLEDHECRFPVVRCRGPIAIISLSSAEPTLPFMATGRIGKAQLQRLDTLLADLEDRKMFRVVLLHHGPVPGSESYRRRLVDGDDLISILKHRGAELVLHGHGHRNTEGFIRTLAVDIPIFGVASASAVSSRTNRNATYNLFNISRQPAGWKVNLSLRTYSPQTNSFISGVPRDIIFRHSGETASM
jgi:3',5'-cyclic AMP phosphodiesterase CpdA